MGFIPRAIDVFPTGHLWSGGFVTKCIASLDQRFSLLKVLPGCSFIPPYQPKKYIYICARVMSGPKMGSSNMGYGFPLGNIQKGYPKSSQEMAPKPKCPVFHTWNGLCTKQTARLLLHLFASLLWLSFCVSLSSIGVGPCGRPG